ncbi:MAG: nuclear transport factor 2 family protein [Rhodospirillales bacterium]|nr:nuclear transport factor 2 family protein [Rhodospirillales bacterium]
MSSKTMTNRKIETTAEDEIRVAVDGWVEAVQKRDLDRIMSYYAPDVVSFDAILALQFKGRDAYRKHWQACLDMCTSEMAFEVRELTVAADRDVAFCHYLLSCGGTKEDGEKEVGWMRATVCYRSIGRRWLIVHEHFSAPFDMESGKALLNLVP